MKKYIVRDSKTGRFAKGWKVNRWPDRFKREAVKRPQERVKELPGIEERKIGKRIEEQIPRERIGDIFKEYAGKGTLLSNFDLDKATYAQDRLNSNLFVIELQAFSEGGSISFAVDIETEEVTEDKPYPKKRGRKGVRYGRKK